ncbi:MAG: hypothetical protein Q9222_003712 [Ikaeria aurantiellina]
MSTGNAPTGETAQARSRALFTKYIKPFEEGIPAKNVSLHKALIEMRNHDNAHLPNFTPMTEADLPTTWAEMENFLVPIRDSTRMSTWLEEVRQSLGIKHIDPAWKLEYAFWRKHREWAEGLGVNVSALKIPELKDETLFARYEECKALLEKHQSLQMRCAEIQGPPPWHTVFRDLYDFQNLVKEVKKYEIDEDKTFELFWSWSEVLDEELERLRAAKEANGGRNLLEMPEGVKMPFGGKF